VATATKTPKDGHLAMREEVPTSHKRNRPLAFWENAPVLDLAEAYEETHSHLIDLVRGLGDAELSRIVPASPAWNVKDVVAHLTGTAADVAAGRPFADLNLLDAWKDPAQAASRDAMTASQVDARRTMELKEVLDEWAGHVELLLPMLRGEQPFPLPVPFTDSIVVIDLATHAQDVRGALETPGDRESAGVGAALSGYMTALELRLRATGLPALRIRYGDKERVLGEGEPAATLSGERYETYRALAGRRTIEQIGAMDWKGTPGPYLPLIPAYGPPGEPIEE
jgi:uncharacterized protein (TIGR03083 family)